MLYAIRALKQIEMALKGRIGLTLVPDEETGGMDGTAWLAQKGLLGRDGIGMLLPEPTSGVVWNANRGAISLRVHVFGKPAHVGLQHQGENAFERMHAVVERLQQLKREVELRTTRFNIGSEQARNSILMLGGESAGGTNFNVVRAECCFTIDRRSNPEDLPLRKPNCWTFWSAASKMASPWNGKSFRKVHQPFATRMERSAKHCSEACTPSPAKLHVLRCAPGY